MRRDTDRLRSRQGCPSLYGAQRDLPTSPYGRRRPVVRPVRRQPARRPCGLWRYASGCNAGIRQGVDDPQGHERHNAMTTPSVPETRDTATSIAGPWASTPKLHRHVVCAAIRAADGALLLGIRHYSKDMHDQIAARRDGEKFTHRLDDDQGFSDQHGVFMSRHEAYAIARLSGQSIDISACRQDPDNGWKLYSEGLY